MNWITKEQVQNVASEKEALELSKKHYAQFAIATYEELVGAIVNKKVSTDWTYCGLCSWTSKEHNSLCGNFCIAWEEDNNICFEAWRKAHSLWKDFSKDMSRHNYNIFRSAAERVLEYLQTLTIEKDKPEDLREFTVIPKRLDNNGFYAACRDDFFVIGNIRNTWIYTLSEATEIHRKLGQLIATDTKERD